MITFLSAARRAAPAKGSWPYPGRGSLEARRASELTPSPKPLGLRISLEGMPASLVVWAGVPPKSPSPTFGGHWILGASKRRASALRRVMPFWLNHGFGSKFGLGRPPPTCVDM